MILLDLIGGLVVGGAIGLGVYFYLNSIKFKGSKK